MVGFATESGAPATSVSDVDVEFLRELGVIRINLPGVSHTSIADGVFESPLVDRAYVVRGQDGSLYVDAHLSSPALARAEIVQSPARVVIQLEAGGEDLPPPAATSDFVVLMTPRDRKGSYPLPVSGYARTFEANVVVRLVKAGSVEAEKTVTATDYLEAWGEFAVTFDQGPQGALDLVVGEGGNDDLSMSLVLN